jgi:hypothetical protein
MNRHLLGNGATAAVLGVFVQLGAAMVEPARVGDADDAIRTIAGRGAWTGRWLVHVAGIMLIVIAVAVVTRISEGTAKEWARVRQPLFIVAGALGMAEVLVGGSTKGPRRRLGYSCARGKTPYLAAFEGAWPEAPTRTGSAGPTTAVAAPLVVVGILLELLSPVGTILGLLGNLLCFVVLIGLGVAMWRRASRGLAAGDELAT